jgi:hypothetical protein
VQEVVLIRQRPSIGDCLLLGPLIQKIKEKHPKSRLTVVTDLEYASGALKIIFEGLNGVDDIQCISPFEWTTESNKTIDPRYRAAPLQLPHIVSKADFIYDCNTAFIQFERQWNGDTPYGIAEFWLRHFGFEPDNLLPVYNIPAQAKSDADTWLSERGGSAAKLVGVVLRAGSYHRDWNFDDKAQRVIEWIYTKGYTPITFDPIQSSPSAYGLSCVGQRLDVVAALLQRCKLLLTPDTGLLHMAEAVGTPTVALWGIMRPELRVKNYNTLVVPVKSLGFCEGQELKGCSCSWKFQQWSCLKRLSLPIITAALEKRL